MKPNVSTLLIVLSCVLMLTSACGKKSLRGVSGGEDLSSNEMTSEGFWGGEEGDPSFVGMEQDAIVEEQSLDASSVGFEEVSLASGTSAWPGDALSDAGLADDQNGTTFAGRERDGSSSESFASGSGLFGAGKGQSSGSAPSSGADSLAREKARNMRASGLRGLGDVYFAYDSWRLSEKAHHVLASNAEWLKAHPHTRITIEGHCDERGTRAYNYILGGRRAEKVKQYLLLLGVPASQMAVVSFGKDRPICRVFTANCFRSNRRAHFTMDVNLASRD